MSEWISVEDRLPDDSIGRVLVWVVEQGSLGSVGYVWNCGYTENIGFIDDSKIYNATHWQPLPEPPK